MNIFRLLRPAGMIALTLAATLFACADRDPTAVTIAITSEASVPKEIDAISLQIYRDSTLVLARSYEIDETTRKVRIPGSLTIFRKREESKTIRIQLRAEQKGEQVLLRSATTSFLEEKNKLLRIVLRYSCIDFPKVCDTGMTCLGGQCKEEFIDPKILPDAPEEESKVFPTVSQGECFDNGDLKCAANRIPISDLPKFSSEDCVFDTQSAEGFKLENLNVFALWNNQSDLGHPIVLDQDPQEGWIPTAVGSSSFKLASGLCDQVKSGKITKVLFNFACATKTATTPVCEPDEPVLTPPIFEDSKCHKCSYSLEEGQLCWDKFQLARKEESSKQLLEEALECPYDGIYNNKEECEGVRSCFLGALLPITQCTSSECDKYKKAIEWIECLSDSKESLSNYCKPVCETEGLPGACK